MRALWYSMYSFVAASSAPMWKFAARKTDDCFFFRYIDSVSTCTMCRKTYNLGLSLASLGWSNAHSAHSLRMRARRASLDLLYDVHLSGIVAGRSRVLRVNVN